MLKQASGIFCSTPSQHRLAMRSKEFVERKLGATRTLVCMADDAYEFLPVDSYNQQAIAKGSIGNRAVKGMREIRAALREREFLSALREATRDTEVTTHASAATRM